MVNKSLEVGNVSHSGIETVFTRLVGIRYPIVAAPMFLVSTPRLVAAALEAGCLGAMPAHNFRPLVNLEAALAEVRRLTSAPFAVNIIVNHANPYKDDHIGACLRAGVPVLITSLGHPGALIKEAHRNGAKVFCDVVDLNYALKVQDLGADGVVAVGAGAGGHAGLITPQVLVPYLKERLSVPVLAAGGIATGRGLLAALALGADAAYIGTRFIASNEAEVSDAYKQAILKSGPEDIIYTARSYGDTRQFHQDPRTGEDGDGSLRASRLSFTRTAGRKRGPAASRYSQPTESSNAQREGTRSRAWKDLWSAGQAVGLVREVKPAADVIDEIVREYESARAVLPSLK